MIDFITFDVPKHLLKEKGTKVVGGSKADICSHELNTRPYRNESQLCFLVPDAL